MSPLALTPAPTPATSPGDGLRAVLQQATLGHYDVYGELGRGGMAIVYLALDIAFGRKVAIKVMAPSILDGPNAIERFRDEAQRTGRLAHPNIVPVYARGDNGQIAYFVMRFVEGQSLDQVVRAEGPQSFDLVRTVLGQVASALAHAHHQGIVHRDIKPANVMLDENGYAVVMDFGIAKALETPGLTSTGTAIGTPYYMSPEQFSGEGVGPLSDQYSLGVVGYELLTGRVPFSGMTLPELMRCHLLEPPPPLSRVRPDCPPDLAACLERMLAKAPDARFPSMDVVVRELGNVSAQAQADVAQRITMLARSGPRLGEISQPISPAIGSIAARPQSGARAGGTPVPTRPLGERGTRATDALPPMWRDATPITHAARRRLVIGAGAAVALVAALASYVLSGDRPGTAVGTQAIVPDSAPAPDARVPPHGARGDLPPSGPRAGEPPSPPRRQAQPLDVDGGRGPGAGGGNRPIGGAPTGERRVVDGTRQGESDGRQAGDPVPVRLPEPRPTDADTAAPAGGGVPRPDSGVTSAPVVDVAPPPPSTATVRVGSRMPTAALYINQRLIGFTNSVQSYTVPAGRVRLSIRTEDCPIAWDTLITVDGGTTATIGIRRPPCT